MFVLVEKWMNGTVTLDTSLTGFDVTLFEDAVDIIKKELKDQNIEIIEDTTDKFSYSIRQKIPCIGIIKNVPMRIISG